MVLLYSAGYALPGAALLLLIVAAGMGAGRDVWERSPLDGALGVLVGSLVVSGLLSQDRSFALTSTAYLMVALYLGYGTAYRVVRRDPDALRMLAWAWSVGAAGAALVGIYFFASRSGAIQGLGASTPALGQTALGTTLALGSLISMGEAVAQRRRVGRLVALALASVSLVGLILTTSRGAWFGWAVGLMVFALVSLTWTSSRSSTAAAAMIIIFAASMVLAAAPSGLRQVIEARERSGPARVYLWTLSLRVIRDHPWFGTGLNTFSRVFHQYLPQGSPYRYENPPFAHNLYLNMIVEGGLVGGLTFIWLLLKPARLGWSYVVRSRDPRALGFLAGYLAVLIREFLDGTILSFHLGIGMAILLGILATLLARHLNHETV